MNNISKQYMKQVKTLFPVMGKQEKNYMEGLSRQVEDICDENEIDSLERLYQVFDKPEDIVHEYFSRMDTDEVVQRIRKTRLFKVMVTWVVIAALAASTYYATSTALYYKAYQETMDNINGYWVDEIE